MPCRRYRVLMHVLLLAHVLIWIVTGELAIIDALGRWLAFRICNRRETCVSRWGALRYRSIACYHWRSKLCILSRTLLCCSPKKAQYPTTPPPSSEFDDPTVYTGGKQLFLTVPARQGSLMGNTQLEEQGPRLFEQECSRLVGTDSWWWLNYTCTCAFTSSNVEVHGYDPVENKHPLGYRSVKTARTIPPPDQKRPNKTKWYCAGSSSTKDSWEAFGVFSTVLCLKYLANRVPKVRDSKPLIFPLTRGSSPARFYVYCFITINTPQIFIKQGNDLLRL
jgi:hypothetical protein